MLRHLINLFMVVSLVLSCQRGPEPMVQWTPELINLSVEPGVASAVLSATVVGTHQAGCEYGFYCGSSEADMQKISSSYLDGEVRASLSGLNPSTKYSFKAYANNQKVEICSHTMVFMTLSEKNEPDQPTGPDEPSGSEPQPSEPQPEPEVSVPQSPSAGYTFSLPYNELVFSPYPNVGIDFQTIGNVRFEAVVPESENWIWIEYAGKRNVLLNVLYNCTGADRSCDIVFKSLDHDCQHVLKVTQSHLEPVIINKSYKQTSFPIYNDHCTDLGLAVTVDENGWAHVLDWITVVAYKDYIKIQLTENNTSQTRMARIKLSSTPEQSLYFLYQTPKQ